MNAAEVVTVQHLVKRYGNVLVVNDVSFSIREGEIFGIIGPNGAGKTTSVECISGLRAPDSGSISVYGLSRLILTISEPACLDNGSVF